MTSFYQRTTEAPKACQFAASDSGRETVEIKAGRDFLFQRRGGGDSRAMREAVVRTIGWTSAIAKLSFTEVVPPRLSGGGRLRAVWSGRSG